MLVSEVELVSYCAVVRAVIVVALRGFLAFFNVALFSSVVVESQLVDSLLLVPTS